MTTTELLERLEQAGVVVEVKDGQLHIDAPKNVLTDSLVAQLRAQKNQLVELLQQQRQPVDADSIAPSFGQERIVYLELLDPGTATYNLPIALKTGVPLRKEAVIEALDELLMRHDALRSRFAIEHGQISVELYGPAELKASQLVTELEASPDVLADFINIPFSIDGQVLLRVGLAGTEHGSTIVFLFHHSIIDGLSTRILVREFFKLYNAIVEGSTAQLPAAGSYYDFAVDQRRELRGPMLNQTREFWRSYLRDAQEGLGFIAKSGSDSERPTITGDRVRALIPIAVAESLRGNLSKHRCTLFNGVLAAYYLALSAFTRRHDIVIGVPVDSRSEQYERTIGLFVNVVPVRLRHRGDGQVAALLEQARDSFLETLTYQDTPLEIIVDAVGAKRTVDQNPLFQTMLSFQDKAEDALPDGVELLKADLDTARLDLTAFIDYADDGLRVSFEYDLRKVSRGIATSLLHTFTAMVAALADPDAAARPVPALLSSASEQAIDRSAARFNRGPQLTTDAAAVTEMIDRAAAMATQQPAVICAGEALDYQTLVQRSKQFAGLLDEHGIGPGDLVGVQLDRSVDLIPILLGIWRCGAAYVPLDPDYPTQRLHYMATDAGLKLVVCDQPTLEFPALVFDASKLDQQKPFDGVAPDPDRLAYVIYTSGSTGKPKGVMVPHRTVINFLQSMAQTPGLKATDRMLAVTTISFDISVLELFLPLTIGACSIVATKQQAADGEQLAQLIGEHQVTVMQATPSTWRLLLATAWSGGSGFRALCGGEPFPKDLQQPLLSHCDEVWNLYGPTETTVWSSAEQLTEGDEVTIGQPISNTGIYIMAEDLTQMPQEVPGEICISGSGVTDGYLNQPQTTAERFVDNPLLPGERLYRTGDLGLLREDGRFEHLGRMDTQIKLRGFRIELGEIEAILNGHEDVEVSVANVWTIDASDQRLVAYIVPKASSLRMVALRKYLRSNLPAHMVPQHLVAIESVPSTPNGKIDRNGLPNPRDVVDTPTQHVAPETPTEQAIAEIWGQLIGTEQVARNAYFFDIGGHSLMAVKARTLMEERLGLGVELRSLVMDSLQQIAQSCDAGLPAAADG